MNLENILNKLDGSIKIAIRVKNPPPYLNHEYNRVDCCYNEWDTVYESLLSYQSSIVDVYLSYGKFEVLRIWHNYNDYRNLESPIMVIDIGECDEQN